MAKNRSSICFTTSVDSPERPDLPVPAQLLKHCAALGREFTPGHARELGSALASYSSRMGADPVVAAIPSPHFAAVANSTHIHARRTDEVR